MATISFHTVMTLYYEVSSAEDVRGEETMCWYELSLESFLCGLSFTRLVRGASFM
jgi:hypothetical protein